MESKDLSKELLSILLAIVGGIVLVGGIFYGLWRIFAGLPHGQLAIWAMVATLLLPVVGLTGYRLGKRAAEEHVAGLQAGVQATVDVAKQVTDIKVGAAQQLRRKPAQGSVNVFFPVPGGPGWPTPVIHRALEPGRGEADEMVEL